MSEVSRWLEGLGLGKYAAVFDEQEIDIDVLVDLDDGDLASLGLPLGPRRKILRAAGALSHDESVPRASNARDALLDSNVESAGIAVEANLSDERKQVTVLFADVAGSTELIAELDPEDAHARLKPALDAMMGAVRRYEGTVNRVQGDGIMALFGAPLAHEDHAARACRAALAMLRGLEDAQGLRIRIGLHSGDVLVHTIRNDLTVDYEAEGPAVHLAARMESLAAPGTVLMTAATRDLAGGAIEVRPAERRQVKGIAETVTTFELSAAPEDRSRWEASAARGLTALAGRRDELDGIAHAAERALAGDGQVFLLVGDAGVGKSRLLHEAVDRLATDGWRTVRSATTPYHRHTTYHAARGLIASALALDLRAQPGELAAEVSRRLAALGDDLADTAPAFLYMLGVRVEDASWNRFNPPQQRRLATDALRRLLVRLSEDAPIAIVVEDLHWLDAGSQSVLDALVDGIASARCVALLSARPGYQPRWSPHSWFTQLPVSPLGDTAARAMLRSLLADDDAETELVERVLERTGGTPLFIEETVRSLADAGVLNGDAGAYRLAGPIDAVDIPASVQAVIAARIDRLAFQPRALLQAAAVIGPAVSMAVLERVAGGEQDDLQGAVATLHRAELMTETRVAPREFAFRHALVRDVAYRGLPRERRRTLHARAGEAIEAIDDGRLGESLEVIAEHYRRGELWERAAPLGLRAARRAKECYEYQRALALGAIALECARHTGDRATHAIAAHTLVGDMHGLAGELEAANSSYDEALALQPPTPTAVRIRNRYHNPRFADRRGARLAYSVNGTSGETIVFLVPVAYDLAMFQPTIEGLCDTFRLVTVEPRGNGRSDPIPPGFTFSDWVDDVCAVIEDLGVGPVHVVGQSRGAAIALRLAERRPDLVKGLVLIGIKSGLSSYAAWLDEFTDELERGNSHGVSRALTMQAFSEPETTDLVEQHVRAMCAIPPETILWFFRNLPDYDASDLAASVTTRALVVHGTDDRNTAFEDGERIARLMPDATFRPFVGRGHLPNFTARAEFCEVVTAFIRGEPVPGAIDIRAWYGRVHEH